MAGVPFEYMEQLATPRTAAAAREYLVRQKHFREARFGLKTFLREQRVSLPLDQFRLWRKAARAGVPPVRQGKEPPVVSDFRAAAEQLEAAGAALDAQLPAELDPARLALLEAARTVLPRYLAFLDPGLRARLEQESQPGALPPRNKKARAHERHLALYLQRVCAKSDSLSEFGPEGWGVIDEASGAAPVALHPRPGIAARETFLERWTAHGLAAALNADPNVRAEIAPRLHPAARLHDQFVERVDSGEKIPVTAQEHQLLRRCDGAARAHALGEPETLGSLAQRGVLRWEVEVPALDAHAFDALVADVRGWREGNLREQWLRLLEPIAELPRQFAGAAAAPARNQTMDEARRRLADLGSARSSTNRILYAATNPIGEECFRDCGFSLGREMADEVARDAAPWFDLWRDAYAFVAGRVAAGLRGCLAKAPLPNGSLPLPAFLRLCESQKLPLTGPGLAVLAHLAFQEIKAAFREEFEERAEASEWELSANDCQFLRRRFEFERFHDYTYPSADLQLAAKSVEAIGRGEYQWIVAELHPPVALLQHGFYWSCPDRELLTRELERTLQGRPAFHFGMFAVDFTSPTTVHVFDALSGLTNFVAPERAHPEWRPIAPAETEVYLDPETGDVCLRRAGGGEYLGSFCRNWIIPFGFHPFQFNRPGHLPRLRCGRVIVQRRTWTVSLEELPADNYSGVSTALVLALEKLRAQRDWPRYIYIRPTEQALRRSGAEGRDKDTKPVFIDLESYLSLEIFHRWLTKAGELEVSEMLPAPDHLFWQEADGRRTFELRTLITPRA